MITLEEVKQQLEQKIKESPATKNYVQGLLSKLEEELSDFKIREGFTNKVVDILKEENADLKKGLAEEREENRALADEIDVLERQLFETTETVQKLKIQNIDLLSELNKRT